MTTNLLRVDNLSVVFKRSRRPAVHAVDDVSLTVAAGRTLGLVGESGSGKTTVGRCVVGLQSPTDGDLFLDGRSLGHKRTRADHRLIQMVFQDPTSSLDPRQRVIDAVGEPLRVQQGAGRRLAREKAREMLREVGLTDALVDRFAHQLSGGQRQRVVIARAMILRPRLTVCDEPVSALDVSVQAQVVNLLAELQEQSGVGYLFIAHDLAVVRHIAHDVAVMHLGRVVESGPAEDVYNNPHHPYTLALMSAVLTTEPDGRGEQRIVLDGEMPSSSNPPEGCSFHTRCFRYEKLGRPGRCRQEVPASIPLPKEQRHEVACHFPTEVSVNPSGRRTC